MEFGKNIRCLLFPANADEPSGALGGHEEAGGGDEREYDLDQHRNTPAPAGGNISASKSNPTAESTSNVPAAHVERVGNRSLFGVGNLVDKERRGITQPRSRDTDKETRNCKSLFVLSSGLHANAEN